MIEGDATKFALIGGAVIGGLAWLPAVATYGPGTVALVVFAIFGVAAVVASTFGLRLLGYNVWGSSDKRYSITDSHSTTHICCVECRHPVKKLR